MTEVTPHPLKTQGFHHFFILLFYDHPPNAVLFFFLLCDDKVNTQLKKMNDWQATKGLQVKCGTPQETKINTTG